MSNIEKGPNGLIVMTSMWHLPDGFDPAQSDELYRNVHVPLVRQLSGIVRHVTMKAIDAHAYRDDLHTGSYRCEDIWFRSIDDMGACLESAAWQEIANGFLRKNVSGLSTDYYYLEAEEYTSGRYKPGKVDRGQAMITKAAWHSAPGADPADLERVYADIHCPPIHAKMEDPHTTIMRHYHLKSIAWPRDAAPRNLRGAMQWNVYNSSDELKPLTLQDEWISMTAGLVYERFLLEEEFVVDDSPRSNSSS